MATKRVVGLTDRQLKREDSSMFSTVPTVGSKRIPGYHQRHTRAGMYSSSKHAGLKINLIGEFSGVHACFARELTRRGHRVTCISSGDGWKASAASIRLSSAKINSRCDHAVKLLWNTQKLIRYTKADIVQIINPIFFSAPLAFNRFIAKAATRRSKVVTMLGCGDDGVMIRDGLPKLKYHFYDEWRRVDNGGKPGLHESNDAYTYNVWLASHLKRIFCTSYEYAIGYQVGTAKARVRPLPLPFDSIVGQEHMVDDPSAPVRILHGITRPGFKGTGIIKEALTRIQAQFGKRVIAQYVTRVPLEVYRDEIRKSHIVIDQINSYGYGMACLEALAMNRVCVSGGESEALEWLGAKDCPVINTCNNVASVEAAVKALVANSGLLVATANSGARYVERYHRASHVVESWLSEIHESIKE